MPKTTQKAAKLTPFIQAILKARTPERVSKIIAAKKNFTGKDLGNAYIAAYLKEQEEGKNGRPCPITSAHFRAISQKIHWTEEDRQDLGELNTLFDMLNDLRNYLSAEKKSCFTASISKRSI